MIKFRIAIISAALVLALISDLRTYKIKNSITYGFMAAGLAINLMFDGLKGMMFSMKGIILPVICLVFLYIMRMIGAGDIKLFGAIGASMGAGFTLHAVICSFICGGVIALLLILTRNNGRERIKYLLSYFKCSIVSMKPLQYADFNHVQDDSRFHFSIAIVSGTAASILLNLYVL